VDVRVLSLVQSLVQSLVRRPPLVEHIGDVGGVHGQEPRAAAGVAATPSSGLGAARRYAATVTVGDLT
jgi:hypothetical protein